MPRAQFDQQLHQLPDQRVVGGAGRCRRRLEQPQHAAQFLECRGGGHQRGDLFGLALGRFFQAVLIDVAIQQADEVKQFADRSTRVEVIIHFFQERGPFFRDLLQAGDAAGIQLSGLALLRGGQSEIALPGNPLEPFEEASEGFQCRCGFRQRFVAEHDGAAILCAEQEESQQLSALAANQLGQSAGALGTADFRLDIGRGFTFAATADFACGRGRLHQAVVQPITDHRFAVAAFALRDLVLVMRKDQVQSAAVDVEGFSQQLAAHGGAFDMPAGPSRAPRAGPGGLTGLGLFPERKVAGGPFPIGRVPAFALHAVDRTVAQLAVARVFGDFEIHVALRLIREPAVHELLDELHDVPDVFGGARHVIDLVDAQRPQVRQVVVRHLLGHLGHGNMTPLGFGDELVIHVRDIDHPGDLIAAIGQVAFHRVEDHGPHHVSDVGFAVDGGTAQVNADATGVHRLEGLFLPRQRVIDTQGNGRCSRFVGRFVGGLWRPFVVAASWVVLLVMLVMLDSSSRFSVNSRACRRVMRRRAGYCTAGGSPADGA